VTIRILIVDDSALVRHTLTAIFSRDRSFTVVGTAKDPFEAREKIRSLSPDVLTLDVEMPRMDGITFLRNLMRLRPMPVVMVSSLTTLGADVSLEALEVGAVDFVAKPSLGTAEGLQELAEEICSKVRAAAGARVQPLREPRTSLPAQAKRRGSMLATTDRIIAIGASTGGTEAIARILEAFPPDAPAVVVAQHIPEVFSARFAQRLDEASAISVREAKDGDPLVLGTAYIAPGNCHLRVVRSGAKYHCSVGHDERVNRHRPSVDVLFRSVAAEVGSNAVGALLTGMGEDGAAGLLAMREAGAPTLAQDKESSVVWGMPGEAVKLGAAAEVIPLDRVAARLLALAAAPRGVAQGEPAEKPPSSSRESSRGRGGPTAR
jgi:two-component system, chemotaxis family, protein-glutamate methylesterase/glutaminase